MLAAFTSCDSTADEYHFDQQSGDYYGQVIVKLYVPEAGIETLDTDTIKQDTINFHVYDEDAVQISVNDLRNMKFNIEFLDNDGKVNSKFQNGLFAKIYNNMSQLHLQGLISDTDFLKFKEEVTTISDTITINGITTNKISSTTFGSMLSTYDWEQSSIYARFTLGEATYTRQSNIFSLMEKAAPVLDYLKSQGALDEALLQELSAIKSQKSGTLTDGSGWCTFTYSNANVNADLHLENATNLLNSLSIALFGATDGKPNKQLWAVIGFKGNWYNSNNYKVVED